jgi:integrase
MRTMARKPKPWYDAERDTWRVTIDGIRHPLAKGKENKAEAELEFMRRMLSRGKAAEPRDDLNVAEVVHLFLDHCVGCVEAGTLKPLSLAFYARHLSSFQKFAGHLRVNQLRPFHIDDHVAAMRQDGRRIGNTTLRGILVSIRRCFNWAKKRGRIESNPVAHLEIPPADNRQQIVTQEQALTILEAIRPGDSFRDYLLALWYTGARPSEVMRVEARQFNAAAATWTFSRSDPRKTRPDRIIHLAPPIVEISCRQAKANPVGPMFRNERRNPWTRHATACRFNRLRHKLNLGSEATAEAFRHLFATDSLAEGMPIATLAELMGHTSTKMITEHYNHIRHRHGHLKDALSSVRGDAKLENQL